MKIKWFSLIRILGLVTVLGYHFFAKAFPGGFIGVDIFFVFSGYLITSLFFIELEKSDSFTLWTYYKRRFMRIFPPLVIMISTTLPFTLLLPSDFRANLAKQVAAAIGFVTNRFEIQSGLSYEAQQTPQLYIHTWTLSLEFLFYLIWGALLFVLVLWLKKQGFTGKKMLSQTRFVVFVFAILASVASIIYLEVTFDPKYLSYSYFAFASHAYPFFIGAMVATVVGVRISEKQQAHFASYPIKKMLLWSGIPILILLLLSLFGKFESSWTIRTNLILTSILTAILIVQFRILHERTTRPEPKVLTILADTSYSIYLFHWPVWLIISHFVPQVLLAGILSFLISFVASAFVYYGIEPYFHGKQPAKWLLSKPFYAGLGVVVLVGFGVMLTAPALSKTERSLHEAAIGEAMVSLDHKGQLSQNLYDIGNNINANTSWGNPAAGFDTSTDMRLKQSTSLSENILDSSQTVLGDSVMVGVVPYLSMILPDADVEAQVGLNLDSILDLFEKQVKAGTLGKYVVISAGANVTNDMTADVQKIIDSAPKGTRLVFVTPYDGKNKAVLNEFSTYLKSLPAKYPWVAIADWATYIEPQDNRLWADKIHFAGKQDVAVDYLNLLAQSLNQIAKSRPKS
ncbi:acyltransferase [Bacilli bacterium]|nr:acyltransferase [Bacilli bacterium]